MTGYVYFVAAEGPNEVKIGYTGAVLPLSVSAAKRAAQRPGFPRPKVRAGQPNYYLVADTEKWVSLRGGREL